MTTDNLRERLIDAIPRHYDDPEAAELAEALSPTVAALVRERVAAVLVLADELDAEAPTREAWDGNEEALMHEIAGRIRAACRADEIGRRDEESA